MIGQHGLSDSVLAEMDSTMLKHELIKIKLRISNREEKLKTINKIIEISKAELIQVIGGVIVIYKPFEDNPDIILPRS
jgi:RNA-binding protein